MLTIRNHAQHVSSDEGDTPIRVSQTRIHPGAIFQGALAQPSDTAMCESPRQGAWKGRWLTAFLLSQRLFLF